MAVTMKNAVKELFKADKVALGMIARLGRSGDIARIAKTTGHDFVFVDGQHAMYSVETTGHIAQAALGCGVVPMARVRSCDDPDTQVLLDNGIMGIVFPDINTAAEAKRAVDRAKFPPISPAIICAEFGTSSSSSNSVARPASPRGSRSISRTCPRASAYTCCEARIATGLRK